MMRTQDAPAPYANFKRSAASGRTCESEKMVESRQSLGTPPQARSAAGKAGDDSTVLNSVCLPPSVFDSSRRQRFVCDCIDGLSYRLSDQYIWASCVSLFNKTGIMKPFVVTPVDTRSEKGDKSD